MDARGFEVDYTYDAASRVKSKVVPAHSPNNITYGYDATAGGNDGVGHLTSVVDPAGTTRFFYNALGQVITETRIYGSHTYATAYTYDPSGHLLTSTSPSGRIVTFGRDVLGRISGITSKQNSGATAATVTASVQYLPFGGYAGATFGNGVVQALGFDLDYQIHTIGAANGATSIQNLTYTPDPAGNITGIADALASSRTQSLSYDDLNRVYTASGLYGSQSYTYDSDGNRLTRTAGATTDTYAYPPTSNRLSTVTTGANVRGFTYAASGQVTEDVRDPSHDYTFPLTRYGRITSAALNGSTAGTYVYDAFENRVQKTAGGTVTDYIYDRFGHLLYEANDATGALTREYIWQDDLPVAIVDDTGASPIVYYIQADHLGTPQKITDGTSTVVWDGAFDPFGNPASITGALTNNLRFPGQYSDAETALNQNWYRDYDPSTGRYSESDPVGLDSGVNTYVYALSNPLRWTDRSGTGVVGGVIGGVLGGLGGAAAGSAVEPGGGTAVGGLEGAEEGYDLGSAAEDLLDAWILLSRGNQDPVQGLTPTNPGRDCDGKCLPCPPDQHWPAAGNAHGSTSGTHYHGIQWNQRPDTCECNPKRVGGPTPTTMK